VTIRRMQMKVLTQLYGASLQSTDIVG